MEKKIFKPQHSTHLFPNRLLYKEVLKFYLDNLAIYPRMISDKVFSNLFRSVFIKSKLTYTCAQEF